MPLRGCSNDFGTAYLGLSRLISSHIILFILLVEHYLFYQSNILHLLISACAFPKAVDRYRHRNRPYHLCIRATYPFQWKKPKIASCAPQASNFHCWKLGMMNNTGNCMYSCQLPANDGHRKSTRWRRRLLFPAAASHCMVHGRVRASCGPVHLGFLASSALTEAARAVAVPHMHAPPCFVTCQCLSRELGNRIRV